jgi:redox-sensitive bicupin YhaK (pirin superfamily)
MQRKSFIVAGIATLFQSNVLFNSSYTFFKSIFKRKTMESNANSTNVILHKAATRGHANHGWLDSYHTFSFANYYDESRIHFGALRVLNDDKIAGGTGFSKHPHSNMEIISIPIYGALEHKDSMGNTTVIQTNDIQIMSAGTGVTHSEYNHLKNDISNFLQIWVFPSEKDIVPNYDQMTLNPEDRYGKLVTIVSPKGEPGVTINQNAWFSRGTLVKGSITSYDVHSPENGVYAFIINGNVTINGQELDTRDGAGFSDTNKLQINATSEADVLLIEVPMLQ